MYVWKKFYVEISNKQGATPTYINYYCKLIIKWAYWINYNSKISQTDTTYSLTSIQNDRETFSWQILFTLRVFARNLLKENRQRKIFLSYFVFDVTWDTVPSFMSNKPTHCDFMQKMICRSQCQ